MGFRDLHRADEDVPRVRVDCLMALDATEAGIFISLISETCHKGPLENGVPPSVHVLERPRFLLHLLVIPPSPHPRIQHTTDNPDASRTNLASKIGDRKTNHSATRTLERH